MTGSTRAALAAGTQQAMQTADHRPRPRDRPEVSADRRDPLLGRRAVRDQVQVLRAVGSHLFEEVRLLLPVQEVPREPEVSWPVWS